MIEYNKEAVVLLALDRFEWFGSNLSCEVSSIGCGKKRYVLIFKPSRHFIVVCSAHRETAIGWGWKDYD